MSPSCPYQDSPISLASRIPDNRDMQFTIETGCGSDDFAFKPIVQDDDERKLPEEDDNAYRQGGNGIGVMNLRRAV